MSGDRERVEIRDEIRIVGELYWWPNGIFVPPRILFSAALAQSPMDPRFVATAERVIAAWSPAP